MFYRIILPDNQGSFVEQARSVFHALNANSKSIDHIKIFLSDPLNQVGSLPPLDNFKAAISIIGQSPINYKIAALVMGDTRKKDFVKVGNLSLIDREEATYAWLTNSFNFSEEVFDQTKGILEIYDAYLKEYTSGSLKDNCVRTWFYINDIDKNYHKFSDSRNFFYANIGMKDKFITSTGIGHIPHVNGYDVKLDALAIIKKPDRNFSINLLNDQNVMPLTTSYNVKFERGVELAFNHFSRVFISGTASIDKYGDVLHKENVIDQLIRSLDNINALMNTHISPMYYLVYIRDITDYDKVYQFMNSNYSPIPFLIVHAPVCRPEWLVEVECEYIWGKC